VQKARKQQRAAGGTDQRAGQGPGPGSRTFEGVEPMGRGRAKAKQVKVARQLKYSGGGMDLDRLRAEIGVGTDHQDPADQSGDGDLADRYGVEDDEDDEDYEDYDDEDDLAEDDLSQDDLDSGTGDRAYR
jgi:Protein of unknown function (DUF3073)